MKITHEYWQNILSATKDILDYEKEYPIGSQRCKLCSVMITQIDHMIIPKEFWDIRICKNCFIATSKDILEEEKEKEKNKEKKT
jgi:hypothetical protein